MSARIAAVLVLAPCLAGCPVPIRHTETLSPPVVGVLHKSDGTPVVGAQVAVAYGYASSPCTRATAQATTDSAGVFRLVATQKDYRVVWVIPNFDRAPPSYLLCVGAGDTLLPARSEEHTSELQSPCNLVCRLLLEKKKPSRRLLVYLA